MVQQILSLLMVSHIGSCWADNKSMRDQLSRATPLHLLFVAQADVCQGFGKEI